MRLLGLMTTKNEAGRYLRSSLEWHKWFLDELAIYDDRSDDETPRLAASLGATVGQRPHDVPSFLEHEGRFRQAAWNWAEEALAAEEGDWIILLDADEFFASSQQTPATCLDEAIKYALKHDHDAITTPIPEVFDFDGGAPLIRKDGFWGDLSQPRVVRYHGNAMFRDEAMGCGTYPATIKNPSSEAYGFSILHYGYANGEDRMTKYKRYSTMNHGHNPQHIESIITRPLLVPWYGPHPPVKRG